MNNEELYQKLNRLVLYIGALIAAIICGAAAPFFAELGDPLLALLYWGAAVLLSSLAFAVQFNGYNRQFWSVVGVSFEPGEIGGESA